MQRIYVSPIKVHGTYSCTMFNVRTYVHSYITSKMFLISNLVTVLCIKELSISTSEHQGIVTVTITTNTSSTDITITVITTDTTGKILLQIRKVM